MRVKTPEDGSSAGAADPIFLKRDLVNGQDTKSSAKECAHLKIRAHKTASPSERSWLRAVRRRKSSIFTEATTHRTQAWGWPSGQIARVCRKVSRGVCQAHVNL